MAAQTGTAARTWVRVARSLGRLVLALLLLGVLTVVTLFFVGRSQWGRQRILAIVLPAIEQQLVGTLRIGALDGDFTHMLVLRDVEIRDAEGQLAVRLPYVGLRYNLLALSARTLHLHAVDIRGAEVRARMLQDGRLNLSSLVRQDSSPPATGPLPLRVLVSGIDAELTADFDGRPARKPTQAPQGPLDQATARLRLRGGLDLQPDRRLSVEVKALDIGSTVPLKAELALHGKLSLSLRDVIHSLALHEVGWTLTSNGEELTRIAQAAGLRGPLSMAATLDGTLTELVTQIQLALPKGRVQLQAKLGLLDKALPWQVALSLDAVEPAALRPGLPPSQIDLSLHGSGQATSGHLTLEKLSLRTARNALHLAGDIEAPSLPWPDPQVAQGELSLRLDARDLSELNQLGIELPPLGGALVGSVRAQMKQRVLQLTANLQGTELRGPGVQLGRLQCQVSTKDLAGTVQLLALDVAAAGQRLARVSLSAEGDQRLVRLTLDGEGPESLKLKLAASARTELVAGSGLFSLQGAQLTSVRAELTELQLRRGGALLTLGSPAQLRLMQLHQAPVVELSPLALSLGALRLTIGGRYEPSGQRLRALVDASHLDVQELVQIATGVAKAPKSELTLHLALAGTIGAPTGQVQLAGQVEPLPGLLPWRVVPQLTATIGDRRVRGELALRTEATPQAQNTPSLKAHFNAPLTKEGAVELKVDAESAVETLRPLLPPTLQALSGMVSAQVNLGGTIQQPHATLQVALPRWRLPPLRGEETTLNLSYKDQKLLAKLGSQVLSVDGEPLLRAELSAQSPLHLGLDVSGSQVIEQLRSTAGSVDLVLHDLALPPLLALAQGPAAKGPLATGTAQLTMQLHGPLLTPTLTAHLDASGLQGLPDSVLGKTALGAKLQLNFQRDDLGLTLDLDLDGKPLIRGEVGTTVRVAELLREGAAGLDRLPIRALVKVLPTALPVGLPLQGTILAQAEAHGTLRQPQFTVDASARELLVGDWPVGDFVAHAALDAQRLLRAQAKVTQKASIGAGWLSMEAGVPVPFDARSAAFKATLGAHKFRLDYQAPKGTNAAVRMVRGTLDSDLTLQGASPQPRVLGSMDLHDGQLLTAALPQLIRDIEVELRALPDGVFKLAQASARADQGRLRIDGGAQLVSGTLRTVDLNATVDNFPVAAGAVGMWLDTKVEVVGRASDDTLRVKVNIPSGTVRLPKLMSGSDSDTQALGPLEDVRFVDAAARAAAAELEASAAKQSAAESSPGSPPPLLPSRTLVRVELPKAFVVTGPEVKTSVGGQLNAELGKLHPEGPVLTGEIQTLGGSVEILSRRYQLERAQVSLSGEVPPNPLLNVLISRKLDDATIYIQVGGTVRKPSITFRSDPAIYDQAQVIGMVLSGSRGGSIQQQALGALSGLLVGKLKDSFGKAVPVDVIKLDVGGNDASGANQSSLEIGKYLRDNLYLSYTHRFGSPSTILRRLNNDQVCLEWYFLPDYQINLMAGDQGVGTLNLYWTKRF